MKGLFIKDIINLKQQWKIYVLIVGVWLVMAIVNHNAAFFGGVVSVLAPLTAITTMAYDEKAKWERYALTMPVSKRDIVLSKYLLLVGVSVIGNVLSIVVGSVIAASVTESLHLSLVFLSQGLFAGAVILPIIFKLGVETGRTVMMVILFLPSIGIVLLSKLFAKFQVSMPNVDMLERYLFVVPIVALVALAISVKISEKIYQNKEF